MVSPPGSPPPPPAAGWPLHDDESSAPLPKPHRASSPHRGPHQQNQTPESRTFPQPPQLAQHPAQPPPRASHHPPQPDPHKPADGSAQKPRSPPPPPAQLALATNPGAPPSAQSHRALGGNLPSL